MKVAPKTILTFKDAEGFSTSLSSSLHLDPNSSLQTKEESFELSLEQYGIQDAKACGDAVHFIDQNGIYQVSILLLENYAPPVLACALNEIFASIMAEKSSAPPTLILPFLVASSKLRGETKRITMVDKKLSLYGVKIGPETDTSKIMVMRTQKPPSTLQIHHEGLACAIHVVQILKIPAFVLIGQKGGQELELLYEMLELLASATCLFFRRDTIVWRPTEMQQEKKEPWRALYG